MANNRMFLVYRPTGDAVMLGKRMGWGWYDVPNDISERIVQLFALAEKAALQNENFSQDDFAVAMEHAARQPYVLSDWHYAELPKIPVPFAAMHKLDIASSVPYGRPEQIFDCQDEEGRQ